MQLVQMHQVTEYVSGKTGEYLRKKISPFGAKIYLDIYLCLDIILFLKAHSWSLTVHFSKRIRSLDKYLRIFLHRMDTTV